MLSLLINTTPQGYVRALRSNIDVNIKVKLCLRLKLQSLVRKLKWGIGGMSVACRSICRPTYRLSVGWEFIARYLGWYVWSTCRPTHLDWYIGQVSVNMSTNISVEHRSICRSTLDRDIHRHIGRGVHKIHMIQNHFKAQPCLIRPLKPKLPSGSTDGGWIQTRRSWNGCYIHARLNEWKWKAVHSHCLTNSHKHKVIVMIMVALHEVMLCFWACPLKQK